MQESFSSEHSSELFCDTFEHFLDSSAVADKGDRHLKSLGRNIAYAGLDVVGNPFHEVAGVLVLHIQHLFVDFLGGHSSSEGGSRG